MKVIILAGGFGTRLSEETDRRPKPMIEINKKPILQHIMEIFAKQGFDEFIVAAGYMSESIFRWKESLDSHLNIEVLETGLNTQTAGRLKICLDNFKLDKFFLTYGDGVGNINLKKLLNLHNKLGRIATVTAVRPPARFGSIDLNGNAVTNFGEKQHSDSGWINGGFFCFEGQIMNYLTGLNESLEFDVLPKITKNGQLSAYKHEGFWQPMDTLREKMQLNELAKISPPPWLNIK